MPAQELLLPGDVDPPVGIFGAEIVDRNAGQSPGRFGQPRGDARAGKVRMRDEDERTAVRSARAASRRI